jgi:IS5 family transposase
MISHESSQLTFHSEIYDRCVPSDHPYRQMQWCLDMKRLSKVIEKRYSKIGTTGYAVESAIKMLLLQFVEDLSDREMERAMRENMAFRWFCGFSPEDETPDFTYFTKLRKRIGTKGIASLYNSFQEMLKEKGYMSETFTFMDASSVISKTHLWKERDRAISQGEETLNNQNVGKHGSDPDASFGAKSKKKFWFGYKRHVSVDMRHGFINKVSMTTAKVSDNDPDVVRSICPDRGMVFADKLYDTSDVRNVLRAKGCASAIIQKNNRKNKNFDLDRWRSSIRMPYENTFSRLSKFARYRGRLKMLFQGFAEAFAFNLKLMGKLCPAV